MPTNASQPDGSQSPQSGQPPPFQFAGLNTQNGPGTFAHPPGPMFNPNPVVNPLPVTGLGPFNFPGLFPQHAPPPPVISNAMTALAGTIRGGGGSQGVDEQHNSSASRRRASPGTRSQQLVANRQAFSSSGGYEAEIFIFPIALKEIQEDYKRKFSLSLDRPSLHNLLDELTRTGLSFKVSTPSKSTHIVDTVNRALLEHMRVTGLRFSSASSQPMSGGRPVPRPTSVLADPSSIAHLWKPAQAVNVSQIESGDRTRPRQIRLQAYATQGPGASDFTFEKYYDRTGKKMFEYRTNSGCNQAVIIYPTSGRVCAPLELLGETHDATAHIQAHKCFANRLLHRLCNTVSIVDCAALDCTRTVYRGPAPATEATTATSTASQVSVPAPAPLPTPTPTTSREHNSNQPSMNAGAAAIARWDAYNARTQAGVEPASSLTIANVSTTRVPTTSIIQSAQPPMPVFDPVVTAEPVQSVTPSTPTLSSIEPPSQSQPQSFPNLSPLHPPSPRIDHPLTAPLGNRGLPSRSRSTSPISVISNMSDIELPSVISSPAPTLGRGVDATLSPGPLVGLQPPTTPNSSAFFDWRFRCDEQLTNAYGYLGLAQVTAPSTTVAARLLIGIIVTNRGRERDPNSVPPFTMKDCSHNITSNNMLLGQRLWSIGSSSDSLQQATGHGPERESVLLALDIVCKELEDRRAMRAIAGGTYTLDVDSRAEESEWERRDLLWCAGFLAVYLIVVIDSGPGMLNFSLIYLALRRHDPPTLLWSQELIAQCDSTAASTLREWLQLVHDATTPFQLAHAMRTRNTTSVNDQELQLVLNTYACESHQEVYHLIREVERERISGSEVTKRIIGGYFYRGPPRDVCASQDFRDFCAGMDVCVPISRFNTLTASGAERRLTDTFSADFSPEVAVATMYHQRIEDPRKVASIITFVTTTQVALLRRREDMFMLRTIRFVLGMGRPSHPDIDTSAGMEQETLSGRPEVARARRFFKMMTGQNDFPPSLRPRIEITFFHGGTPIEAPLMAAEQAEHLARAPPDFHIQSCFMKAKIWLNDYIVNLLKEPTDWSNPSQATAFDCWMYNQLFATSHTYTTL